jgi:hypothetical protein
VRYHSLSIPENAWVTKSNCVFLERRWPRAKLLEMERTKISARRTTGGLALLGALALLICGETFLKAQLKGVAYILYWMACLVLTTIAIIAAFMDVRALQRRTRREQEVLIEETFEAMGKKPGKPGEGR